ncbi:hypothetical protein EVAR_14015_1 [Eumeta japonica]|uniref:Uncharacterized protein n=1 Tax=Eumeta variegata TaxID=151549 RepID=A0A4C1XAP6_EUMVA|nr:hypothetical protein EVAR_14015_1 [Eumeta japonica]
MVFLRIKETFFFVCEVVYSVISNRLGADGRYKGDSRSTASRRNATENCEARAEYTSEALHHFCPHRKNPYSVALMGKDPRCGLTRR